MKAEAMLPTNGSTRTSSKRTEASSVIPNPVPFNDATEKNASD
jgi:hypothetical protein